MLSIDRAFLEGVGTFNSVFMQLVPGSKRTIRTWDYFEELHAQRGESRVDLAEAWLLKGYGVGYLLRGRLAAIDADSVATVQRVMEFEKANPSLRMPKVHTPSGGIHALFVHPTSIDGTRLKNHVCHPKEGKEIIPWDFKLGERTMLVAPGTINQKGAYRSPGWSQPPIFDVRALAPGLAIYRNIKSFTRDCRPLRDRIIAAMSYIRRYAPISVDGSGGNRALRQVAEHLVAYHDLDPSLAFYLLTTSKSGQDRDGGAVDYVAWNDRCRDRNGKPFPWGEEDLSRALEDAVDAAPAYGVHVFEMAQKKDFARQCAASFIEALSFLPEPKEAVWVTPTDVFDLFIEVFGVDRYTYGISELGLEITHAINQGKLPFVYRDRTNAKGRIYRGMNLSMIGFAMGAHEQRQRSFGLAS